MYHHLTVLPRLRVDEVHAVDAGRHGVNAGRGLDGEDRPGLVLSDRRVHKELAFSSRVLAAAVGYQSDSLLVTLTHGQSLFYIFTPEVSQLTMGKRKVVI